MYCDYNYEMINWVPDVLCIPYCQAVEIINDKLLTLSCDVLPEFWSFFAENLHFLENFIFENLNNELKCGHGNEVRAGYGKLKINFAKPNTIFRVLMNLGWTFVLCLSLCHISYSFIASYGEAVFVSYWWILTQLLWKSGWIIIKTWGWEWVQVKHWWLQKQMNLQEMFQICEGFWKGGWGCGS